MCASLIIGHPFTLNCPFHRAAVLGMRAVGKGHAATLTLSGYLGLPTPINKNAWAKHTTTVANNVSTTKPGY